MKRTAETHARRRELADAASGITRATVVLYVRTSAGEDPAPLLGALRRHAHARDWTVLEEIVDPEPGPAAERPEWQRTLVLLAGGAAQGLITTPHALGDVDQAEFQLWLSDQEAFLSESTEPEPCRP